MPKLTVLKVPGLTVGMVQRGDAMAEIFELIAEGALAEVEPRPGGPSELVMAWRGQFEPVLDTRLEEAVAEHGADSPQAIAVLRGVDRRIGELRSKGALAVVSEHVFISPRPIAGLRPGTRLTAEEVAAHLRGIADGPRQTPPAPEGDAHDAMP